MLRQGLRRCAPVKRAPFALSTASPCQPLVSQVARTQRVTVLPPLRNAFHLSRILSQSATADAPVASDAAEPASALPEFMAFEDSIAAGVHPNLIRAITQDMKYTHMSEVQERTLQAMLKGKDMVAQAKTGTGKTLAFLLPMLQRMIDADPLLAERAGARTARPDDIRGIVISPTRELAEQIAAEAKRLVRHTGLVVQVAVGGTRKREMLMGLQRRGCHLLVATPGRLNDILEDPVAQVKAPKLDALVLDEADRMLDVGFAPTLEDIKRKLPDPRDRPHQTMLFSATIPPKVIDLAKAMVRRDQFEFVQTIKEDDAPTHERVPQEIAICRGYIQLFPTLYEIIDREIEKAANTPGARPFKAIVYFNTTTMAEMAMALNQNMRRQENSSISRTPTMFIHGKIAQNQRTRAADNFRRARSAILFSSDVTARGMDFPNVTHVIQIGVPRDREQYIHRLGRTGRQGKEGSGYLIIPESDAREAAQQLAGVGLKDSKDLESPHVKIQTAEDLPERFQSVTEAFTQLSDSLLGQTYTSLFGGLSSRDIHQALPEINTWATVGWGKERPPPVNSHWLKKMGYQGVRGFNVSSGFREREDRSFSRGPSRDGFQPSSSSSFDDFESQFGQQQQRRGGGGGFRQRSNSFGGGRGRGDRDFGGRSRGRGSWDN